MQTLADQSEVEQDLLVSVVGRVGVITLNRTKALNALSLVMIRGISAALEDWGRCSNIETVVIRTSSRRAFCAGGDLNVVRKGAVERSGVAEQLWREQHLLNAQIHRYPLPIISVMEGITMGGGVGLGCHARYRVVSDNSVLAMPEVSIGASPDVGACLLFARAPGLVGTHLAMTAGRMSWADALWCGFADYALNEEAISGLLSKLQSLTPSAALDELCIRVDVPSRSALAQNRGWIDEAYSADGVPSIVKALATHTNEHAKEAHAAIMRMAPTAILVTYKALQNAKSFSGLEDCLQQDYRVLLRCLESADLNEGIRAMIVDKDKTPRWSPESLEAVSIDDVDRFFQWLGNRELYPTRKS